MLERGGFLLRAFGSLSSAEVFRLLRCEAGGYGIWSRPAGPGARAYCRTCRPGNNSPARHRLPDSVGNGFAFLRWHLGSS